MSDVTPEAEALARVLFRTNIRNGDHELTVAQRAIDAGWTPPPDPHVEIARDLWEAMGNADDVPVAYVTWTECVAAVRRMDLRRGDQ